MTLGVLKKSWLLRKIHWVASSTLYENTKQDEHKQEKVCWLLISQFYLLDKTVRVLSSKTLFLFLTPFFFYAIFLPGFFVFSPFASNHLYFGNLEVKREKNRFLQQQSGILTTISFFLLLSPRTTTTGAWIIDLFAWTSRKTNWRPSFFFLGWFQAINKIIQPVSYMHSAGYFTHVQRKVERVEWKREIEKNRCEKLRLNEKQERKLVKEMRKKEKKWEDNVLDSTQNQW